MGSVRGFGDRFATNKDMGLVPYALIPFDRRAAVHLSSNAWRGKALARRKPTQRGSGAPSSAWTIAVGVSLMFSALLSAAALRNPALHWLAWVSLLPLFQVIRKRRPAVAAVAGGVWGLCLFGFAAVGPSPVIPPTLLSLILLSAAPAMYCGIGARVTRWIGFNPLVLGLGWVGVELAIRPLGLPLGLMAGTQGGSALALWGGRLLGYVLIAFLVACFNASLIALLSCTHWLRPAKAALSGWLPTEAFTLPQPVFALQQLALHESSPRAPPRR